MTSNITRHGDRRMRERMGIPRKSVQRMATRALREGIPRTETKGSLRRYLDALYHYNENANNIRVWSEKVWIFSGNTLITVLDLHQRYKNRANGIQGGKANNESNTE